VLGWWVEEGILEGRRGGEGWLRRSMKIIGLRCGVVRWGVVGG